MRVLIFSFCLLFIFTNSFSQTVVNGGFNSLTFGWGCSPEANYFETTYGGTDPANRVAEVDAAAGLCQTISGFSIGALYSLDFICSRRTTCGPALQSMDVSIDGGGLAPTNVSRTGAFGFTAESFTFVATSASHTIDFSATIVGTCGLIVDDIAINPISLLPIELSNFSLLLTENCEVDLYWTTKSERNNDYFVIEHSANGTDWKEIGRQNGAGNSTSILHYYFTDLKPTLGTSYYRLKQVDIDGFFSYTHSISVNGNCESNLIFPNPTSDYIFIPSSKNYSECYCFDNLGKDLTHIIKHNYDKDNHLIIIALSNLSCGTYIFRIDRKVYKVVKI